MFQHGAIKCSGTITVKQSLLCLKNFSRDPISRLRKDTMPVECFSSWQGSQAPLTLSHQHWSSLCSEGCSCRGNYPFWFVLREKNTQGAGSSTRLDVPTNNINSHHSINTPEIQLFYFLLGMLLLTNKQKQKLKYLQSLFGPFSAKCTTGK